MKHLLNDLSEEEKNRIREQHTGGKKIMIENFNQLLNKKLGEVKPLINEQEIDGEEEESETPYINPKFAELGYQKVDEVNLADGEYIGNPIPELYDLPDFAKLNSVENVFIFTKDKKYTGYILELSMASRSGEDNLPVSITGKKVTIDGNPKRTFSSYYKQSTSQPSTTVNEQETQTTKTINTKVASEGLKNISDEMVKAAPFIGEYSSSSISGVFNGINYNWDFSGVEGMLGVKGIVQGKITSGYNSDLSNPEDLNGKPIESFFNSKQKTGSEVVPNNNNVWVGFKGTSSSTNFACFTNASGKITCKNYIWRYKQ
jgi:hypothetical protein